MTGYEQICTRIKERRCEAKYWMDRIIFNEVCSVNFGSSCVHKQGGLDFSQRDAGCANPLQVFPQSKLNTNLQIAVGQ